MPSTPKIPWDIMKAETLRSICKDLGVGGHIRSKDEMIAFLDDVEKSGLDAAIEKHPESEQQLSRKRSRKSLATSEEKTNPEPERRSKRRASGNGIQSDAAVERQTRSSTNAAAGKSGKSFDGIVLSGSKKSPRAGRAKRTEIGGEEETAAHLDVDNGVADGGEEQDVGEQGPSREDSEKENVEPRPEDVPEDLPILHSSVSVPAVEENADEIEAKGLEDDSVAPPQVTEQITVTSAQTLSEDDAVNGGTVITETITESFVVSI